MPTPVELVAALPVGGWSALFLVGTAWNLAIAVWGLFFRAHMGRVVLGDPPSAPGMLMVGGLGLLYGMTGLDPSTMHAGILLGGLLKPVIVAPLLYGAITKKRPPMAAGIAVGDLLFAGLFLVFIAGRAAIPEARWLL